MTNDKARRGAPIQMNIFLLPILDAGSISEMYPKIKPEKAITTFPTANAVAFKNDPSLNPNSWS